MTLPTHVWKALRKKPSLTLPLPSMRRTYGLRLYLDNSLHEGGAQFFLILEQASGDERNNWSVAAESLCNSSSSCLELLAIHSYSHK